MFGFGKKKASEDGALAVPGGGQTEKEILAKVIFHVMPKVEGASALSLANAGAPSGEKQKEKPKEEPKAASRPSLAPPPQPASPKLAVTPPPLISPQVGGPPLPHGAAKILPIAPSRNKWMVIGVIASVLVIALGAGGWYWYRFVRVTPESERGTLTLSPGQTTGVASTDDTAIDGTAPSEFGAPSLLEMHFLADRGLISTRDSDADLLTDVEEELFGTDPNLPDTDFDGWPDGWEIVHLYDPVQGAAERLIENARMTAFQNEQYGYTALYQNAWVAQAVDASDPKDVVLTSATGEFIQITAEPYGDHAFGTLEESYLRDKYPGGSLYTLHPITNKFGVKGFETADGLTAFFEGANTLYTIRYMPGLRTEVNFKRTMAMLVAGFLVNEGVPPAIKPSIYNPGVPGFAQPRMDEFGNVTITPAVAVTSTAPVASVTTTPF